MPKSSKKQITSRSIHTRSRACSKCGRTFTATGNWRKVKRVDTLLRLHITKCQGNCRIPDAILDLMTQKELDGRKNCGEDEKTLENYTTQSTLSNDGKTMSVQKVVNAKGINSKGAAGAHYVKESLKRAALDGCLKREVEAYKGILSAQRTGKTIQIFICPKKGSVSIGTKKQ